MSKPELLPCPFCGSDPLERAIEPHTHSGPLKALGIPDHPGSHVIECGCGAGMIAEAKDAVRAMWNRRETYNYQQARIAELEDKSDELDRLLKEALMAFDIICPECRKQWLHRHCGELPVTEKDERISAQQWLLEQCQQSLREHSETYVELDAYLRGDIDHNEVLVIKAEHEAALTQQGKEGE